MNYSTVVTVHTVGLARGTTQLNQAAYFRNKKTQKYHTRYDRYCTYFQFYVMRLPKPWADFLRKTRGRSRFRFAPAGAQNVPANEPRTY